MMPVFYPGEFNSVKDKDNIYKAWEKFLKSDCDLRHFTRSLYKHLSLHWGFIAHYDINGFYHARFEDLGEEGILWTFKSILDRTQTYRFRDENTSGNADLNKAMYEIAQLHWPRIETISLRREIEAERRKAEASEQRAQSIENRLST
jgi:hypothetical protein